jgi:hypothetical protein
VAQGGDDNGNTGGVTQEHTLNQVYEMNSRSQEGNEGQGGSKDAF